MGAANGVVAAMRLGTLHIVVPVSLVPVLTAGVVIMATYGNSVVAIC